MLICNPFVIFCADDPGNSRQITPQMYLFPARSGKQIGCLLSLLPAAFRKQLSAVCQPESRLFRHGMVKIQAICPAVQCQMGFIGIHTAVQFRHFLLSNIRRIGNDNIKYTIQTVRLQGIALQDGQPWFR